MKLTALPLAAVVACAALCAKPSSASETVLVIGDSLSREYAVEFPNFDEARNWVELLAEERQGDFDFGSESAGAYQYNRSLPTTSAEDWSDLLTGNSIAQKLFQDRTNDFFRRRRFRDRLPRWQRHR